MNEELIARYNAIVSPTDNVLWVGDVSMKLSVVHTAELLQRFNGRKSLILGNHDGNYARASRLGFDLVAEECFLHLAGRVCRVKHYPYALHAHEIAALKKSGDYIDDRYPDRRPPRVKGEVLLHGHTHSNRKVRENQIHVGCDAWDYAPAPIAEVEKLVAAV